MICIRIPHCTEYPDSRKHVEDRAWDMVGEAIAKKLRADQTIACRVRVSEHAKDYSATWGDGLYVYTLVVDVLDIVINKHQFHIDLFEHVSVQSLAALPKRAREAIQRAPAGKPVAMPSRLFDLENE